ncbi:hypothetical protein D3C71_1911270 [compost metagenome]
MVSRWVGPYMQLVTGRLAHASQFLRMLLPKLLGSGAERLHTLDFITTQRRAKGLTPLLELLEGSWL